MFPDYISVSYDYALNRISLNAFRIRSSEKLSCFINCYKERMLYEFHFCLHEEVILEQAGNLNLSGNQILTWHEQ